MPFDFNSFLLQETGVKWDIQELFGGTANFTVRVHGNAKPVTSGLYPDVLTAHPSAVLKQAPPYLAKDPSIPFSPYRQTVEAEALKLLHSSNSLLGSLLHKNPLIKVPSLLLEDKSAGIIVQSDLGSHPTLEHVLASPATTTHLASVLGHSIGKFTFDLHNALRFPTGDASESDLPDTKSLITMRDKFLNPDSSRIIADIIVNVKGYMKDAGVPDYEALGDWAFEHWDTRKKTVFGQGDLWYGTLLVDVGEQQEEGRQVTPMIGICDWEFAGPNDPACDIGQLGAYLHLLALSPSQTSQSIAVISAFAESMYSAYFDALTLDGAALKNFQRSLMIMHGWEMINAAAWGSRQDMWCRCPGGGIRCTHIHDMVTTGAAFLRAAGDRDSNVDGHDWLPLLRDVAWSKFFRLSSRS